MTHFRWAVPLLACAASPAFAGPPYLTDDPEPTDTGHWEIYAFGAAEGRHSTVEGSAGLDINYGAAEGVQLTATVPLSFSHAPSGGWQSGRGDLELAVKYRFLNDEAHGFSAAVFPRAILPTASHSPGERTRFLLPLWTQLDFAGGTSLFGGGGYTINPGAGNRDYWQAGVALTHDVSKKVSLGAEITRQGSDTQAGTAQTRAGIGAIVQLSGRYALLFSGGPTFADHQTAYHAYAALGTNF
ncbi:MAG: transporter [Sphingomicrobium sp.]